MPAGWWSTPYYLPISLSPPPRQEGTFANFVTLQYNILFSHNLSVEPPVDVMNEVITENVDFH
jgi:hypothetical protein